MGVSRSAPSGRAIRRGPKVSTLQEVAAVVASGEAICLVHSDAARYYQWPGLRYLRPYDAPVGSWVLIWPTAGETGLVRAFAQAAQDADREQGDRMPN
ncbi:LysR substrate-binding domain-containing protein [Streptomyces sp. NPDC006288]|uniref:LysR substrate-binding domain-containing protein n=1 Tax=Streptomyces sp. NPDC006288 TaxID=3156743 RepID=UPI0033B4B7C9